MKQTHTKQHQPMKTKTYKQLITERGTEHLSESELCHRNLTPTSKPFLVVACLIVGWLGIAATARASCTGSCPIDFSNTALGQDALLSLISGGSNTAIGNDALYSDQYAGFNTAVGVSALFTTKRRVIRRWVLPLSQKIMTVVIIRPSARTRYIAILAALTM